MKNSASTPFFFIIGRPRSGTTLIRMLFDAHPHVNIPIESPFIVSMYGRYGKISSWNSQRLLRFYHDLFTFQHFDEWTLDPEKLKHDILAMEGNHTFQELVKVVYSHYISVYPKQEILLQGDKNPYFTLYIRRLVKIFPEARFLFIYRDYRDHFYSMSRVNFEADIPALIGWRWKYFVRDTERFVKAYPEKCLVFRYEDFVENPAKYNTIFSDFLRIPCVEQVLNFHEGIETAKQYHQAEMDKYHTSLMKPVNKGRIGLWRENLTDKQVQHLDGVVGKWARVAGYEKKFPHTSPFVWLRTRPMVLYGMLMYFAIKTGDILPFALKNWLLARLGFFLRVYQKRKITKRA
ncbi:MAG: sulfotransferase [Bacteroidales bacterium]|nr:sulfotransferase [Bacteroidales bacterium]MDD2322859.1 sulfotransferase [Bacteroidales bacterium]MDD3010906.1 sulfotransferase [Bacteroidales bacterium]MDD3962692.1 sulfotransferase [Bacteroidales bacterium]MDY0285677.1 sulfotransferase [Bacteroidales bacterium]